MNYFFAHVICSIFGFIMAEYLVSIMEQRRNRRRLQELVRIHRLEQKEEQENYDSE